ncbi:MAG: hypothetical protein AABZ30_01695 [Myxococcota bacterium]
MSSFPSRIRALALRVLGALATAPGCGPRQNSPVPFGPPNEHDDAGHDNAGVDGGDESEAESEAEAGSSGLFSQE